MITDQAPVLRRNRQHPLRGRQGALGRKKLKLSSERRIQKLLADLPSYHLGDERWYGIAHHPLHLGSTAIDPEVVREGLNAAKFLEGELPVSHHLELLWDVPIAWWSS